MKRAILSLLFLIFFNTCFGQTYSFDKLVTNEVSPASYPNQENTYLFNSEDYSYSMHLNARKDSIKTWIIDRKRKQVHYFSKENKDSLLLNFVKTENYTDKLPKYTYEFSDIKSKRKKEKVSLTIFNEEKKKIAKYKLTIKETDQNFFPLFQLTGAVEPFHLMNIKAPFNFKVIKSKGRNIDGYTVNYKLSYIEDVEVVATIPTKD